MPDSITSSRFLSRFPALAYRDFRLLWFGQIVSIAGSQMQYVAIGWQIYDRTDSPVMLGMIGLVRVVPIIFFSLVGGVIADTYRRRKIMLVTQSVMLSSAAVLAFVTMKGESSPAFILILTAISSAAAAFDGPARQSLMPNLVAPEHLTNAVSLNSMMFQFAAIIGPALAGLIIGGMGEAAVYWINAASFLAVILALVAMRHVEERRSEGTKADFASLLEGLRFVRSNRMIFSTMLLDFFATFFASANALLPIYARDILNVGPTGLGFLYAAESVGSLLAGVVVSMMGDIRRKGLVLLTSVAAYGVATAIYGFSTNFYLALFLLGLVGVGDAVSTVLRQTIRQTVTPDYIRGRMSAVNMIFFMGGPQLGNLEAGLLAAALGPALSVAIGGVAVLGVVIITAWRFPDLRSYRG